MNALFLAVNNWRKKLNFYYEKLQENYPPIPPPENRLLRSFVFLFLARNFPLGNQLGQFFFQTLGSVFL